MHQQELLFVPQSDLLRRVVASRKTWIESKMKTPLSECVLLPVNLDLAQVALQHHLRLAPADANARQTRLIHRLVQAAEIPEDDLPLVSMVNALPRARHWITAYHRQQTDAKNRLLRSDLVWNDSPVALHFNTLATPVIAWTVNCLRGPGATEDESTHILIVPRNSVEQVVRLFDLLDRPDHTPRIHMLNGASQAISRCSWDDMTLESSVIELLKDDVTFFLHNRKWFEAARLPYRRGVLLHGAPGNGKSCSVRCIMTEHGLSAYTLQLFANETDDSTLSELFAKAARNSPSIVLLEDLDRAFPKTGDRKCGISLQHLLNTLDGLLSQEGIITIASANLPTDLDPAILRRPGRFDRVIQFASPNAQMRAEYFRQRVPGLPDVTYERLADVTDGTSYSDLREVYIIAGQRAFAARRDISLGDLLRGIKTLKETRTAGTRHSKTAGF